MKNIIWTRLSRDEPPRTHPFKGFMQKRGKMAPVPDGAPMKADVKEMNFLPQGGRNAWMLY